MDDDDDDEYDNYYENHIEVDLRDRGYFNEVENQGCGECCYAYAALGAVEYLHNKKQKGQNRVILSKQDLFNNLVYGENEAEEDAKEDDDGGGDDENQNNENEHKKVAQGKSIHQTLKWIHSNGCVLQETCPYTGIVVPPKPLVERENEVRLRIETYKPVELDNIEEHIRTVGPVIAAMDWIGEMDELEGDEIYAGPVDAAAFKKAEGHAVLIVGFGPDYWLIRNSYGDQWGNAGYAKITRASVHGRFLIDGGWAPVGIAYWDTNRRNYNAI